MSDTIALLDQNIAMFKTYGPAHAHRVAELEQTKALLLAHQRGEVSTAALPWSALQWLVKLEQRDLYGT